MYRSLEVHGFRCFAQLSVRDLARVNIIAGRNNAGKTALLEAVYLHAMGGTPAALLNVVRQRGHRLATSDAPLDQLPWQTLFRGFATEGQVWVEADAPPLALLQPELPLIPDGGRDGFGASARLTLRELADEADWADYYEHVRSRFSPSARERLEAEGPGPTLALEFRLARMKPQRYYITASDVQRPLLTARASEATSVPFIAARTLSAYEDASRFRSVALEKRTDDLVAVLKVIEPRLTDIQVLPVGNRGAALYGDIGLSQLVSLSDMGDGMNRLASLILAISSARAGVVLVDEVENGLHHTVQVDVWRAIADAARRFDVQVFATSHSLECIAAAQRAFKAQGQDDLRVHRLQRVRDQVHDFVYWGDELDAAIEQGMEVR